jgi:hypothetical protein
MQCIYKAVTGGAVALGAAAAKSVLGVKAHANSGVDILGFGVGFDGASSTAVPVLVELCYATFATNAPGTGSTSVTPVQVGGRVLAVGGTAAKTWTAEPTVLTVVDEFLVHPQSGWREFKPQGQTYDSALGEGYVIRLTAPATVNARADILYTRI